jgi:hypothetical protein
LAHNLGNSAQAQAEAAFRQQDEVLRAAVFGMPNGGSQGLAAARETMREAMREAIARQEAHDRRLREEIFNAAGRELRELVARIGDLGWTRMKEMGKR